jgi:hypothetical protein
MIQDHLTGISPEKHLQMEDIIKNTLATAYAGIFFLFTPEIYENQ